jgi:hypothetical protein
MKLNLIFILLFNFYLYDFLIKLFPYIIWNTYNSPQKGAEETFLAYLKGKDRSI